MKKKKGGGKKLKLRNKHSSTLTKIAEALVIGPSARKQLIKIIKSLNEEVKAGKDLIDFSEEVTLKKSIKTSNKETAAEKEDLLNLNKEDIKAIKKLREKFLEPTVKQESKVLKTSKSQSKIAHKNGNAWQKM